MHNQINSALLIQAMRKEKVPSLVGRFASWIRKLYERKTIEPKKTCAHCLQNYQRARANINKSQEDVRLRVVQ